MSDHAALTGTISMARAFLNIEYPHGHMSLRLPEALVDIPIESVRKWMQLLYEYRWTSANASSMSYIKMYLDKLEEFVFAYCEDDIIDTVADVRALWEDINKRK